MNSEDIQILFQLIDSTSDAVSKLEEYYQKRDVENFNKFKKVVLDFQQKISEIIGK